MEFLKCQCGGELRVITFITEHLRNLNWTVISLKTPTIWFPEEHIILYHQF